MKRAFVMIFLVLMVGVGGLFAADLSQEDIDEISWVREEEKLARDVYLTLSDMWGIRAFERIASSEQTHMDAIAEELIIPYGLEDPVTTDEVGVFSNPELQKLYDELVAKGSRSVEEAVLIGMTIEDMDIFDLQEAMDQSDNADLDTVFANLMNASGNHMIAFNRQAERLGLEYEPQYITEQELAAILSGAPGNNNGNQMGYAGNSERPGYSGNNGRTSGKGNVNHPGNSHSSRPGRGNQSNPGKGNTGSNGNGSNQAGNGNQFGNGQQDNGQKGRNW